ncbi:MAG: hypothetical protein LBL66_04850 [Clostridiales bacterium]|nr:hypothetical protein [Clostridiales bacterium]
MKKGQIKPQKPASPRAEFAAAEYARLIEAYKAAGADELRLKINDGLIRKVAEVYGILEAMKDLPTLRAVNKTTVETGAGKARVKYMAQYTASMAKLNKDLLGVLGEPAADELEEYDD